MIATSHRWGKTAIATTAVALLSLSTTEVFALSLGRLAVRSALGEPLRAEIDVLSLTPEEAASLRVGIAKPADFAAAGMEYSSALTNLQATLERRSNGAPFIRLITNSAVDDAFVDIILEATWASGRVVRDYTVLLDPSRPTEPVAAPVYPLLDVGLAQTANPVPGSATATEKAANTSDAQSTPSATAQSEASALAESKASDGSAADSTQSDAAAQQNHQGGESVVVKKGDTASKIISKFKPVGISLDQMLIALLRSNPDAFMGGNVNRLRAGAVLTMPSAEQAQSLAPKQASRMVLAQSKDFNRFRQQLANSAPKTVTNAPGRTATGSVEAKVEESKRTPATPDKLTLSKATAANKAAEEEKIAKERAARDAQARIAEINKNIDTLNKLAPATTPRPSNKPASGVAVPVDIAALATAPAASMPQATPSAAVKKPLAQPEAAEKPKNLSEFLASLRENPLFAPVGIGILAALAGLLALYVVRRGKKKFPSHDSSFLASGLRSPSEFPANKPRMDSGFGNTQSSLMYPPNQLDMGAFEPAQAEVAAPIENARTALANSGPLRTAAREFTENLTTPGSGYQDAFAATPASEPVPPAASATAMGAAPSAAATQDAKNSIDIDLDFSDSEHIDLLSEESPPQAHPSAHGDVHAAEHASTTPLPFLETPAPTLETTPEPATSAAAPLPVQPTELSGPPPTAPSSSSDMLEFDLSALSLDLQPLAPAQVPETPRSGNQDALRTKLALAQEFSSIGDRDGARALVEEVLAHAEGEVREQAQQALTSLG